jgi:hypothetical protein
MMRRAVVCLMSMCALAWTGTEARNGRPQAQASQAEPSAQAPAPAADENWMPSEVKNLTVLPKDTSPADVMKIMRDWNAALNVQCVFCHVGQIGKPLSTFDFASDSKKRKDVSRIMLQGVMAMNEKFKAIEDDTPKVTCASCHKRSRHVTDELPAAPSSSEHQQ